MDKIERDAQNVLKNMKKEGGESDLLFLQRYFQTYSVLHDSSSEFIE